HGGPGGHAGGELLDEPRIAGAAAGQHQLVVRPRADPALDPAGDGLYREGRRRRDRVVVRATDALHLVDQPRGVVRTEVLAPGALGRSRGEVGVGEQRLEHLAGRLAAAGAAAVQTEPRAGR